LRFAAEEFLQDIHFFLGTTAFEDSVAISSAFLCVHRVGFEDRVKHVCLVDLGLEVAVVTSIIATNQVAKSSLTVAPVPVTLLVALQ